MVGRLRSNSCDVLVVGGGPAGLAAAIALRMCGGDVLVADALKPPIDKACGEGLMPDARRDLAELGVSCESGEGAICQGIRLADWAHAEPVSVTAEFSTGQGVGVPRVLLHARLVERAQEVGVRLRWNTHVGLARDVTLNHELCDYRYLVGADGQSSRVRRWADLEDGSMISRRFGFRRHYRVAPWSPYVEVHWTASGQVYVTPVAADEICVAVVTRRSTARVRDVIGAIPFLHERLQQHHELDAERGSLTTTRKLKRVVRGNVALIGDASGSVDAVTGEGLALSFRQARLLSESLERNTLKHYSAGHPRIMTLPQTMARLLLLMETHPAWRNYAMRAMASSPSIFRGLLDVHLGEATIPGFLKQNAAQITSSLVFPRSVEGNRSEAAI